MSLKLPRYATPVTYPRWYTVDISQRYCNEVRISILLHREAVGVVPFVGVYSTEAHPFGLIYEYMGGLDLKQFSKNKPYIGRLKLVRVPMHAFSINNLMLFDDSSLV